MFIRFDELYAISGGERKPPKMGESSMATGSYVIDSSCGGALRGWQSATAILANLSLQE
jgi:hypothetical protein